MLDAQSDDGKRPAMMLILNQGQAGGRQVPEAISNSHRLLLVQVPPKLERLQCEALHSPRISVHTANGTDGWAGATYMLLLGQDNVETNLAAHEEKRPSNKITTFGQIISQQSAMHNNRALCDLLNAADHSGRLQRAASGSGRLPSTRHD